MTRFLLVTSNGAGMGHLTRQAALALSMEAADEVTVLSMSRAVPVVADLGISYEYCPSYDRPWLATHSWDSYLRDRLVALAKETRAEIIVFDGVAPYVGVLSAAWDLRDIAFVWLRRGMWKSANRRALKMSPAFDMVIEPGDLAAANDTGPTSSLTDAVGVGPISILEPLHLMTRAEARQRLALPADRPVALVTLGSGMLGDAEGPGQVALRTLVEKSKRWHVAMTRPPVSRNDPPVIDSDRLTILSGVYPLAEYLSAFDLAVTSAGYNAVHELVPAGVPSLLVANTSTRTDDQTARAASMERQGFALATVDSDHDGLQDKLHILDEDSKRAALRTRAQETANLLTGAAETVSRISGLRQPPGGREHTVSEMALFTSERAKAFARRAMGVRTTQSLKRLMRRPIRPVYGRSRVTLTGGTGGGSGRLAVVRTVSIEELNGSQPIEHILDNGSPDYERHRRQIIDQYYDVTRP